MIDYGSISWDLTIQVFHTQFMHKKCMYNVGPSDVYAANNKYILFIVRFTKYYVFSIVVLPLSLDPGFIDKLVKP